MAETIFGVLKADFDTKIFPSGNIPAYYEILSCLAHILNLIVKEFLGVNNFYIL
jgi:hypothetical protein